VTARIHALKELHDAGISTYAFVGPILPTVLANEKQIGDVLDALENAGVGTVWFEHINISSKIQERLFTYLKKDHPEYIPLFKQADTNGYREKLDAIVESAMKGRTMTMAMGQVIHHKTVKKIRQT
jgi:DNA repair photolyase